MTIVSEEKMENSYVVVAWLFPSVHRSFCPAGGMYSTIIKADSMTGLIDKLNKTIGNDCYKLEITEINN